MYVCCIAWPTSRSHHPLYLTIALNYLTTRNDHPFHQQTRHPPRGGYPRLGNCSRKVERKGRCGREGGHCGPHRPHPPHTPGPQASGLSPDARVLPGGGLCPRVVRTSNAPGRHHAFRNIHDASPTTNAMLVRMNLKLVALVCGVARSAIRAFYFFARRLM